MKMEIGFQAPVAGVVREVLARKGQQIAAGEVLLLIEPVADEAPLTAAIDRLRDGGYAWCGFTSANAVELTFEHLAERGLDARSFAGTRVFAIGPATADALQAHGITADIVPDEYVAEAVVEAMRPHVSEGDAVLLPLAESARAELVTGLEALGATVDEIVVYRAAVPSKPDPEALARAIGASGAGTELYFNYESKETKPWGDAQLQTAHGYRAIYPASGAGLLVEL